MAEVVASLSLATDLGAGGSFEDALRACLTATRLSGLLGLPDEQHTNVYYLPLVALVGCSSTAHMASTVFGPEIETFSHSYETDPTDEMAMMRAMLPAIGEGRPLLERLAIFGKMFANRDMFDRDVIAALTLHGGLSRITTDYLDRQRSAPGRARSQ